MPARLSLLLATVLAANLAVAEEFPNPLPKEPIPNVATLPEHYPTTWAFLDYSGARFELRNVGSDAHEAKGNLPARESTAALLVSTQRPEIYLADTVWSRGSFGTRTDFIDIYDPKTLTLKGEIVLPGPRGLMSPREGTFSFTDSERMGLIFNFTPASAVTIVDLVGRKVLGKVDIPGCSLAYPTGERGFTALCQSGTALTVRLDAQGKVVGRSETTTFNALDTDPVFTSSALINKIRYFPTMQGNVRPLDLSGDDAKVLPAWSLVSPEEAAQHWAPGGWQVSATDEKRLFYVLMHPDAHEGTQKIAGPEVWVFDVTTRKRVSRLRLVRPGVSIAVTLNSEPMLLVQTTTGLDVYNAGTGAWLRTLQLPGLNTRMLIHPIH
jgi:methylamine dehydrogenase heavy chain